MFKSKIETIEASPNEDPDLASIRHYHGNWQNFFQYWKKRGVKTDPYKDTKLIHPYTQVPNQSTLPIQDFGTYDKSKQNRLIESFDEFLNLKRAKLI